MVLYLETFMFLQKLLLLLVLFIEILSYQQKTAYRFIIIFFTPIVKQNGPDNCKEISQSAPHRRYGTNQEQLSRARTVNRVCRVPSRSIPPTIPQASKVQIRSAF